MTFGAPEILPQSRGLTAGEGRLVPPRIGHRLLGDGGVRISLPADGILTDAEARRLAWGLLADLAPDEVVPASTFVTYKEAQRLAVLRAVAGGVRTPKALTQALEWSLRTVQRRTRELVDDGRLRCVAEAPNDPDRYFVLTCPGADL